MTQKHHITYSPEWIVPLTGWQHKVITHMQRMKPTETNELKARNFVHAVIYEWQRISAQLAEIEQRNLNP